MGSTATPDTNTTTLFQISDDKYTASIELSNACREFYRSRIKAAEIARKKLECDSNFDKTDTGSNTSSTSNASNATTTNNHHTRKKTTIDIAMEQLRREMNSLMDQDLSLMKQLLILNETIEDLKVQRGYLSSRGSLPSSSCDLSESQWSVSETEMFESENDLANKYASPSTLSLNLEHTSDFEDIINEANKKMCITKKFFERKNGDQSPTKINAGVNSNSNSGTSNNAVINNNNNNTNINNNISSSSSKNYFDNDFSKRAKHEEQNSFDSGIHEANFDPKITV